MFIVTYFTSDVKYIVKNSNFDEKNRFGSHSGADLFAYTVLIFISPVKVDVF